MAVTTGVLVSLTSNWLLEAFNKNNLLFTSATINIETIEQTQFYCFKRGEIAIDNEYWFT